MTSSNDSARPPSADEAFEWAMQYTQPEVAMRQKYEDLDAWATERIAAETERAARAYARAERLKYALAQILLECGDTAFPGETLSTVEDLAHGALRHDDQR